MELQTNDHTVILSRMELHTNDQTAMLNGLKQQSTSSNRDIEPTGSAGKLIKQRY
jgi:hypothetical protein